ncbi:MAG: S1C family serine protease [Chloroflexota bacterium]
MRTNSVRFLLLTLLATLLVACGAAETVDTDAIAATVAAQLQSDLEQTEAPTPEPTAETVPVNAPESQPLAVAGLQDALSNVYEQANPSVVHIIVPPIGTGSGFVYNTDGHIVTNNHVVDGGDTFEVVFSDGERREAELIGADVDSDLAVIQVDSLPDGVQPLPLADAETLDVGQIVVAIGNPFRAEGSMSMGIISALGRSLPSQRMLQSGSTYSLPEVVQTDAPINPGNSGGPLLNLQGEVIGINSTIASTTGANSGVGFAIPVPAVAQIVPSLIENGSYDYSYMGAGFDDEISLAEQETFGLSQTRGTYVLNVTEGSPADEAGLVAANPNTGRGGDLVIAIDGQSVDDFSGLNAYLVFNTEPGQTIELTVLRDGEEMTLPLTLASRP